MNFSDLVTERRSIKAYDSSKTVSDEELKALFDEVVLSPSAFNLQHWAFVVMRDPELKKRAREAANGQPQVEDSSAAILVAGKLDGYKDAERIFAETPEDVRERAVPMIHGFYDGNAALQRDEAIRSASLAAMTLMYSAKNRGYDTGPMIGFDPDAMAELLNLPSNYVPVMLVVLGHGNGAAFPRAYRRPLGEIVRLETFDGTGLA